MESPLDPTPGSGNNNMGSIYETEGGRGCRNKRRQTNPTFCPVCKCTLRQSDVDQHLNCELEKLQKISKFKWSRSSNTPSTSAGNAQASSSSSGQSQSHTFSQNEQYRKYQQVRNNRQLRQKAKCKRRKLNDGSSTSATHEDDVYPGPSNVVVHNESSHADLQCPVCYQSKIRTEITMHVERCLARSERRRQRSLEESTSAAATADAEPRPSSSRQREGDAESSFDDCSTDYECDGAEVDNDEIDVESFEEYEWAGQSRVRATSMIPGGIASLLASVSQAHPPPANGSTSTSHDAEVDEDLVVDDDDRFGPAEYYEADMIHSSSGRERKEDTLRRAVLSPIISSYLPAIAPEYTINTQRSKSAEPVTGESREEKSDVERLEKRSNSDPLPGPSRRINTPTIEPATSSTEMSSFYTYPYPPSQPLVPHTTSPASISPPPPIFGPIDNSLLPQPLDSDGSSSESSDSSSPIPLLTPINPYEDMNPFEDNTATVPEEEDRVLVSMPADFMVPIMSSSSSSMEYMLPLARLNAVPRLSTIAQDVADRAHVTGANPAPSTSSVGGNEAPINQLVIESLFARIRELETRLEGDIYKCLICMDRYRKPVISINCWHVHCEECWLRTLGAKKLCPQCNAITTPNDLRKIFI